MGERRGGKEKEETEEERAAKTEDSTGVES